MKKKLVPLLLVAFAVAVVSTGVFYGLIVGKLRSASDAQRQRTIVVAARALDPGTVLNKNDVKLSPWAGTELPKGAFSSLEQVAGLTLVQPVNETEPVTQARVASRESQAGAAVAVPAGMRAVSIRVSDSPGVVALLRAGNKVDIQVVRQRGGPTAEAELRTILQNVDVLTTHAEGQSRSGPSSSAVLTVLVKPTEAEMLGLADSSARIRVVLRNPLDTDRSALAGSSLASMFSGSPAAGSVRVLRAARFSHAQPAGAPGAASPRVQLRVRIAGAEPSAIEDLSARLVAPRGPEPFQVSAFRPGWDLDKAVQSYQSKHSLEILSASQLVTTSNKEVSVRAGSRSQAGCGVRIQFLPWVTAPGKVRLRVQPEITSPRKDGLAIRKVETSLELSDGQSFFISGLVEPGEAACGPERLFPGRSAAHSRELVVLVTPHVIAPGTAGPQTAALLGKP